MRINELFDKPLEYELTKMGNGSISATFQTSSIKYLMRMIVTDEEDIKRDGVDLNIGDKTIYEVLFRIDPTDPQAKKVDSYGITGTGAAEQIMATVIEIIKNVKQQNPNIVLYFSAKEPSRAKLYSRLVKNLAAKYEFFKENNISNYIVYL